MQNRTIRLNLCLIVIVIVSLLAFQAAANVSSLDQLASQLLYASRQHLSGQIVVDPVRSQGFAAISWQGNVGTIFVHPNSLQRESLNTWAFVIGHELGHHLLQHRSKTGPPQETAADLLGARMAITAGYDVKAYIRKIYTDANSCSLTHGCWHSRARNLEQTFGAVGGWNPRHAQHKPGTGPLPPQHSTTSQVVHVQCSHPVACQHRIACQHLVYTWYGWQRQHQYDLLHTYDQAHVYDVMHQAGYGHSHK